MKTKRIFIELVLASLFAILRKKLSPILWGLVIWYINRAIDDYAHDLITSILFYLFEICKVIFRCIIG